jgi:hypothetical protein
MDKHSELLAHINQMLIVLRRLQNVPSELITSSASEKIEEIIKSTEDLLEEAKGNKQ